MRTHSKLRFSSWVVAASAVLAPASLLAHQLVEFNERAQAQGGLVCGMPVLAMWFLAIAACVILSLIASFLNGAHLRRSRPVAAKRYVELGVIAAPAVAGVALVLFAVAGR